MDVSTPRSLKKTLLAGAIGNALEWYDFALYGYFAPVFAALFFPSERPSLSLISAFGVFAIGFLARPLGALLFGYWGDTVGRREALAWSVILMAIPSCFIGLLPTYEMIGMAAPLALTLCRFLQGLSVGGEFTGSVTFLVEHAAPSQRGYIGSWAGFSAQMGALLGSAVGALVATVVSDEALRLWGWRIPFLLGSLIALVGWYVRTHVSESPAFEQVRQAGTLSSSPIREVFADQQPAVAKVIGLVLLHGVAFYLLYVYLATYIVTVTSVALGAALTVNTVCMGLLAVLMPVMGGLADKVGQKPLMVGGAAGLATASYPLFIWLTGDHLLFMIAAQVLLTLLLSCYMGPFFAAVVGLFPTPQRYTGLSVGYNIASALFGGTAPLVAALLIEWSGNSLAPSFYLSLCAAISLGVVFTLREEPPQPLAR
ncbi:MAG: MHS family MFS transporter [Nitrospirae bacterium]|nr:MAG: MHS family MFS transporter [Nitrospirota bacterium]